MPSGVAHIYLTCLALNSRTFPEGIADQTRLVCGSSMQYPWNADSTGLIDISVQRALARRYPVSAGPVGFVVLAFSASS
jgi:hypothetical protein